MRIAVVNLDRCKPRTCGDYLCMKVCPKVRTGDETITIDEDKERPIISEELCTGCGICVHKCPFDAITIVNLPEELGDPIHQYGVNGFRLFNLPTPKDGVVGIVGVNGIGKTTALKILSGEYVPNMGGDAEWDEIIERFRGNEIQNYLEKLSEGDVKAVYKPQYVDSIPEHVKGVSRELLEKGDEGGRLRDLVGSLNMENALDKEISSLSGGELQRLAIIAALEKEADIYLIDEPSSYLDVSERLNVARTIRAMEGKQVLVIEHDLVVLDYLSDFVHVIYGKPGAYGIITNIKSVRVGINEYLHGYLRAENMKFRDPIAFDTSPPQKRQADAGSIEYPDMGKGFTGFSLKVNEGTLYHEEILGILGPNATGKTTFVKLLAGAEEPDAGKLDLGVRVSYKPQYIKPTDALVEAMGISPEIVQEMGIEHFFGKTATQLSGGELQKVAIADCLSRDADLYLLDEPSAYLDVEERLKAAKYLKKFLHDREAAVLVVDHDILFIDYLSDKLMVFEGEPGRSGSASSPVALRDGMNSFLRAMDVTFRRDPESGRPRANKPGSQKDREQRGAGEFYYTKT